MLGAAMQENTAAEDAQAFGTSPDDPVFATEQAHLSEEMCIRDRE